MDDTPDPSGGWQVRELRTKACWNCQTPHSAPLAIYRCTTCRTAHCYGELYVGPPLMHRLSTQGKLLCGPVHCIGEADDAMSSPLA